MRATIAFYLTLFLRRVHWFILIFGVVSAASITIARILPPVYESNVRLLVEPPQIPSNLAASTVQTSASEELQIIQQRLMTRVNLLEIARSENVFPDIGSMSPDEVVAGMRDATSINLAAGSGQATLMNISFVSDRPQVAAGVLNRYVTIVLQSNSQFRNERAGQTLEFFEVEVERLGKELEVQSARILEFNKQNSDALPTTLSFRLNQQAAMQNRLAVIERDVANYRDQRQRLIDIFQSTGDVAQAPQQQSTPERQKLQNLETQLNDALAIFSPDHPRVKLLQAQVSAQRDVVAREAALTQGTTVQPQTGATILDFQLADLDGRITALEDERVLTEDALARLNDTIERTPQVQIELDALNREYANIQTQYNQAVGGLAAAATGERIEALAQGRRINVIDPATVPSQPIRPNRLAIAIGGTVFGALLGLALIVALEFLNSSIRRPAEIIGKLGITPIATVPYIRTPFEQVARRAAFAVLFIGVFIGVPAALYAIHTFYLPLDLIYDRLAGRIGNLL